MSKVKLSGIYTEALVNLLSDKGVDASAEEKTDEGSTDTLVYDKKDRNGVTVNGALSEKVVEVLKKELPDVVYHKTETGAIYCGLVKEIDRDSNKVVIDLGLSKDGELPMKSYWGLFKEGAKVMVQVKGETSDKVLLSTQLRMFGDNLIIIKDGFTKVSKHVKDKDERKRLMDLSEKMDLKGWGILWKALAENKDDKELKKEIKDLIKEEGTVKQEFDKAKGPKRLKDGLCIHFIDFGKESKDKLDKWRSKTEETMKGYHTLKSMGYSFAAELGSALSGKKDVLSEVVMRSARPGDSYKFIINQIDDRAVYRKGEVIGVDDGIKIRCGRTDKDCSVFLLKQGQMSVKETKFKDGEEEGVRHMVCTPVEVLPRKARCIDLVMEVVGEGKEAEVRDKDALETALEAGAISKGLKDDAVKVANEIVGGKSG